MKYHRAAPYKDLTMEMIDVYLTPDKFDELVHGGERGKAEPSQEELILQDGRTLPQVGNRLTIAAKNEKHRPDTNPVVAIGFDVVTPDGKVFKVQATTTYNALSAAFTILSNTPLLRR